MIEDNATKIMEALKSDMNRSYFETYASDIASVKDHIQFILKHLDDWAEDEPIDAGFILGTLGKARIRKEPLGVALIIGTWNFPFLLVFAPMLAAIAAGCCVMLKPSEITSSSERLVVEMVSTYMDPLAVQVVTGGVKETKFMLGHKFDHIFYTGSNKVAPFITAAAAPHLTPTVLELGGQGPAIVTSTADVDMAAKRVAYSKALNAGQVCLSTNHVFADPLIYDDFVQRLAFWNDEFLSQGDGEIASCVNEQNFDRLDRLLGSTDGTISYGGRRDRITRSFTPTVVTNVSLTDSLLSEEIFGPILPVIKADYVSAYKQVGKMPHALGLYIFSSSQNEISEILANTNSGGVTINDVFVHSILPNAPFGGVGASGNGSYHGVYGFNTFTHRRSVVEPPLWLERLIKFRYPPYKMENIKYVDVKNSAGFKRGETIEDQKAKTGKWFTTESLGWWVKFMVVIMAMAFADEKSGGRIGLVGLLGSTLSKLRELVLKAS